MGGVFRIFKPDRIEKIVTDVQARDEAEMQKLRDAGITPVIVSATDKDHMGTVYDKEDDEGQQDLFNKPAKSRWNETEVE